MKCKKKDCQDCVHFVDLQKHPLFADMQIQTEDGKPVQYEGCIFHVQTMFMMQLWKRQIGVQGAIESSRNVTKEALDGFSTAIQSMAVVSLKLNSGQEEPTETLDTVRIPECMNPSL